MSSQYENEMAKLMYRNGPDYIRPYRAGYSGNGALPQPDIHLFDNHTGIAHDLEVKGPIKGEKIRIDEDDARQLEELRGPLTRTYLVIKFQRRAPITLPFLTQLGDDEEREPLEQLRYVAEQTYPFLNPRIPGEYLYLDKPPLDDWVSATEADADEIEILRTLGIFNEDKET